MTSNNGPVPGGRPTPQQPGTAYQAPRRGSKRDRRPKKPFWRRWWFWLIVVLIVIGAAASTSGGSSTDGTTGASQTQSSQTQSSQTGGAGTSDGSTGQKKSEEPSVPADYRSALRQAETYANTMHMSKQGVYDQLTSEYGGQFSAKAAQYAIDNVKADWNANALAKAKTYQEDMAMSPEAIRDQLTSKDGEKFTADEANYAIEHLNGGAVVAGRATDDVAGRADSSPNAQQHPIIERNTPCEKPFDVKKASKP